MTAVLGPLAPTALPTPPRLLWPAAAAGVVAAALVPGHAVGLGLALAAATAGTAGVIGAPRARTPWGVATLAVAAMLVGVVVVRDASWLVVLCLVGAGGLWSLALAGAAGWIGSVTGTAAVALAGVHTPAFLRHTLAHRGGDRLVRWLPALRGALVALGLLVVFGGLFLTADVAFRNLAARVLLPDLGPLIPARLGLLAGTFLLVTAAGLVALTPPHDPALPSYSRRRLGRAEWLVPLLALDALFAAFVAVQLAVLFGGHDHVLRTAGLSYADYAHQGFGQLVVAAGLTLVVVAIAVHVVTPHASVVDRRALQVALGLLVVLTLVVLASAARRLEVYEEAYGFTRLRLSVDAFIRWLAVVLLLVLAAVARLRARWLPRALMLSAGLGLLAFAVGNPDGRIAERNTQRLAATGLIDTGYLTTLSVDAVPAAQRLPEPHRSCVLRAVSSGLATDEPWTAANRARAAARASLAASPPLPAHLAPCPPTSLAHRSGTSARIDS